MPEEILSRFGYYPHHQINILGQENGIVYISRPYPHGRIWTGISSGYGPLEAFGGLQDFEAHFDSLEKTIVALKEVEKVVWKVMPILEFPILDRRSPDLSYYSFLLAYMYGDTISLRESFSATAMKSSIATQLIDEMDSYDRIHYSFGEQAVDSISVVNEAGFRILFTKENGEYKISSFSKFDLK